MSDNVYKRLNRELAIAASLTVTAVVTAFLFLYADYRDVKESLEGQYEINANYAAYMDGLGLQYPLPDGDGCSTDCGYGE